MYILKDSEQIANLYSQLVEILRHVAVSFKDDLGSQIRLYQQLVVSYEIGVASRS